MLRGEEAMGCTHDSVEMVGTADTHAVAMVGDKNTCTPGCPQVIL